MGQYWTFLNLDDKESLSTHEFGSGLKYVEQWFSGSLYTALMLLCTDKSSLGLGGGDFRLDEAPSELAALIEVVMGRWAGKRIVFAGDYTEVEEHKDDEDEEGDMKFTDITSETAIAVWAMVASDRIRHTPSSFSGEELIEFLRHKASSSYPWERCKNLDVVLQKLEELTKKAAGEGGDPTMRNSDADEADRSPKRAKSESV